MIKTILWDWNGTLLDDVVANLEVINLVLSGYGRKPLDMETYRNAFTMPVIDFYRAIGLELEPAAFERLAEDYTAAYREAFPGIGLTAGVPELLARLSSRGISHFVLSATRQDLLESQVESKGIAELFAGLQGNGNLHGGSKEASAAALLGREGLDPGETLVVGDLLHDRDVALSLGARCVLYAGGHQALRGTGCEVVSSLDSVAFASVFR